jgi:hypothetical protein
LFFVLFLRFLDGKFLLFVVIIGVKHLRGRCVEPAGGCGLQAVFWGDCETAEKESSGGDVAKTLSLQRSRRLAGVGDVELNSLCEPEYVL